MGRPKKNPDNDLPPVAAATAKSGDYLTINADGSVQNPPLASLPTGELLLAMIQKQQTQIDELKARWEVNSQIPTYAVAGANPGDVVERTLLIRHGIPSESEASRCGVHLIKQSHDLHGRPIVTLHGTLSNIVSFANSCAATDAEAEKMKRKTG